MQIRLGRVEDAAAIAKMLARLAVELGDGERFASTEATVREYGFGASPKFFTHLAEMPSGEFAGLALYFPHFSTTRGQPGIYLQDLWIEPYARGQVLGELLLGAVAEHASRAWGAAYLALTVHGHNEGALRFYSRLGLKVATGDRLMAIDGQAFAMFVASRKARM